ncbi:MAG: endonuclease domain-containing protein [Chloroflexota bacterium]
MIPRYDSNLNENARYLRNHSTRAERIVWGFIRKKQMFGYGFYRQKPIGQYIADFYCKELDLLIEVDGISHNSSEAQAKDREKDAYYTSLGMKVFRITDEEVLGNGNLAEQKLREFIQNMEKGYRITPPL